MAQDARAAATLVEILFYEALHTVSCSLTSIYLSQKKYVLGILEAQALLGKLSLSNGVVSVV